MECSKPARIRFTTAPRTPGDASAFRSDANFRSRRALGSAARISRTEYLDRNQLLEISRLDRSDLLRGSLPHARSLFAKAFRSGVHQRVRRNISDRLRRLLVLPVPFPRILAA